MSPRLSRVNIDLKTIENSWFFKHSDAKNVGKDELAEQDFAACRDLSDVNCSKSRENFGAPGIAWYLARVAVRARFGFAERPFRQTHPYPHFLSAAW